MEITIQSREELNKLLDVLARDIVDANIYYRLWISLSEATKEYPAEFAQSPTFWCLTMQALKEAYLTRLCRVFDQNTDTLNLFNLLDTIKANSHFFEEPHFRERIKENAFVSSLAKDARIPALAELQTDIAFSRSKNPIVLKLNQWRGNFHAHLGAKVALGKAPFMKARVIEQAEMDNLLEECFRILNRYTSLYNASSWSRQIVGHDDFHSLLKFIRRGIASYDTEIQAQLKSLDIDDPSVAS